MITGYPDDGRCFSLIRVMSGTLITRPYSPRLISRRPCKISAPMSRLFLAILHLFANLPQHLRGDVVCNVLGVHRQHPDHALRCLRVVDHPIAAALPATGRAPPQFAYTPAARNDRPSFRPFDQDSLEISILIVRQVLPDEAREEPRLDEAEHGPIIRQCRTESTRGGSWPNGLPMSRALVRRRPRSALDQFACIFSRTHPRMSSASATPLALVIFLTASASADSGFPSQHRQSAGGIADRHALRACPSADR